MNEKDLRLSAETSLLKKEVLKNQNLERLSPEEVSLIIHDLKVHKIELEIQNEELQRTQRELENAKARYFDLYDLAPEGYLVVSEKGLILESNLTAANLLGYGRKDILNKRLSVFIVKEDQDSYYLHRAKLFKTLLPQECELRMIKNEGTTFWAHMKAIVVINEDNPTCRLILSDVSERRQAENELQYLCYHDHLTDLYNRRFFEKELIRLDVKENQPISIIMYDINGLKLVNDSFGHESGDALLKKAAEVIKNACREEDIVARTGGDEFVVLLPKTTLEETLQIANHIKELASKEKVANIELSISYGYDSKTSENQSILDVIGNAENHMYQHKIYERSSLRSKTIDLIMNTLFEKSKREAMHAKRVGIICQSIAAKMNLDNNAVSKMKIAGLIHDIGKIGVQEEILNKIGTLTIDERREIQRHPEIGWRLLSSTNEFSEMAKFILAHHEKWDGSGYPNGLKGEEIPLEARIITVADSYDAMTSERTYRKGITQEEAIIEMKRCAGTHFDPKIVEVFVNQVLPDSSVSKNIDISNNY